MNTVSNQNDFKVVQFKNSTDFDFLPEMGCMYDSNPISGISGTVGIKSGESITLPYHIGHRLAVNLAKVVMTRKAPAIDPAGIPTGVPLWNEEGLERLKNTFITDLYSESKPIAQSETERLMAKVEELNKFVRENVKTVDVAPSTPQVEKTDTKYQDKAEVIAELEKRNIQHDKRKSKAELEKLLV